MEIKIHDKGNFRIAEVISEKVIIKSTEDALDLLGDLYQYDTDRIIIREQNITPDFFVLKNKLAGGILQKFSNYRIRFAIIGEFQKYPGHSLRDFIYESNKGKQVNFVNDLDEAINALSA